jgi:hypothetical protein
MRKVQAVAMFMACSWGVAACGGDSGGGSGAANPTPVAGAGVVAPGGGGTTGTVGGTPGAGAGGTTGGGGAGTSGVLPPPTAGAAGTTAMVPTGPCASCPECDANCQYPDIRGTGSCMGLNSGFPGDEACLPAPDPSEGIQIHVGPADYGSPGDYVFPAGMESSLCKDFVTPNTADVFYQGWIVSARTGTHHIIDTCYTTAVNPAGGFGPCRDPGIGNVPGSFRIPGASKPYMPRGPVAPENADLGSKIPAMAQCQADMHYFNFSSAPVLREFWMNLYTKPPEEIKQEAAGIRGMGGTSWLLLPIAPGTDKVYKYQFPPAAPTGMNPRIISLLGHYHAHGERFTAYINGMKVFEMFDYNEPLIFHYNSVTMNPDFAPEMKQGGATSGMIPIKAGDVLSWECHIINDGAVGLTYSNEVMNGEMCNLWGSSVDVKFDAVLP